jgi:hypothetical protein
VCARNLRVAHRIARSTRGRGRPKSGEDDLGSPVRFYRVWELEKLHGPLAKLTEGQAQLVRGWSELAAVAEARAVMAGGGKLARAKEGRLASEGEHGVRWGAPRGGFKGAGERGRVWPRGGSDKRLGRARASASARSGVWHSVEHKAAQREVEFKRGLAPNLWDYGHDPVERSLPLTFLCRLCVEACRFRWLDQEIWRGEVGFVSLSSIERRSRVWRVQSTCPDAIFWYEVEGLVRHIFVNWSIRIRAKDQGERARF